ncbi:MAG: substrate-binding domain-containing protein [Betaproteobacteria bacterium]|nr:substrate-binding domain-containing protein [Betaproteobacteria bacterium]
MKLVSLASAATLGAIAGAVLLAPVAQAAEVTVFVTGAARRSYDTLIPRFERASGHKLVNHYALPPDLIKKMEAGEPFDVIVLSYDVEGLVKQGKLAANSRTVFGRSGIGVAVRRGAPKPDFSTVEAFKRSLLNAKTVATSGEGSSGRYIASLIERLGIAEQVKPKIRSGGPGESVRLLSRGDVDFAVSGLPPLLGTPNIEWLGYIPAEIQFWIVFSAGLNTKAREPEAGRALLKFLTAPAAVAVFEENGIDPVTP